MEITVARILRRGRSSLRILLSSGEEVLVSVDDGYNVGDIYAVTSSSDTSAIRFRSPYDEVPTPLVLD